MIIDSIDFLISRRDHSSSNLVFGEYLAPILSVSYPMTWAYFLERQRGVACLGNPIYFYIRYSQPFIISDFGTLTLDCYSSSSHERGRWTEVTSIISEFGICICTLSSEASLEVLRTLRAEPIRATPCCRIRSRRFLRHTVQKLRRKGVL